MKIRFISVAILSVGILLSSCGSKAESKNAPPKDTNIKVLDTVPAEQHKVDTVPLKVSVDGDIDDGLVIDPNASPENVVKTIIKAAKTGKYGPLLKICNEAIDMDGDAKDICNIGNSDEGHQKEFKDYFGNAKIVGKARINKGIGEVDIETTAEGGSKETIIVQIKYDKWYLKGL